MFPDKDGDDVDVAAGRHKHEHEHEHEHEPHLGLISHTSWIQPPSIPTSHPILLPPKPKKSRKNSTVSRAHHDCAHRRSYTGVGGELPSRAVFGPFSRGGRLAPLRTPLACPHLIKLRPYRRVQRILSRCISQHEGALHQFLTGLAGRVSVFFWTQGLGSRECLLR